MRAWPLFRPHSTHTLGGLGGCPTNQALCEAPRRLNLRRVFAAKVIKQSEQEEENQQEPEIEHEVGEQQPVPYAARPCLLSWVHPFVRLCEDAFLRLPSFARAELSAIILGTKILYTIYIDN